MEGAKGYRIHLNITKRNVFQRNILDKSGPSSTREVVDYPQFATKMLNNQFNINFTGNSVHVSSSLSVSRRLRDFVLKLATAPILFRISNRICDGGMMTFYFYPRMTLVLLKILLKLLPTFMNPFCYFTILCNAITLFPRKSSRASPSILL